MWLVGPRTVHDLGLSICVSVSAFGAVMAAVDLRLRFWAKLFFVQPHWTYLLFNRNVGLAAQDFPAWLVGAAFFVAGVILLLAA